MFTGNTYDDIESDNGYYNGRNEILQYIDVLVDGPFEYDKRDITLAFRGSSNQRIIDVKSSLKNGKIVLYDLKE